MNWKFNLENVEITNGEKSIKIGNLVTDVTDFNVLDLAEIIKQLPPVIREVKEILEEQNTLPYPLPFPHLFDGSDLDGCDPCGLGCDCDGDYNDDRVDNITGALEFVSVMQAGTHEAKDGTYHVSFVPALEPAETEEEVEETTTEPAPFSPSVNEIVEPDNPFEQKEEVLMFPEPF